MTSPTTSPRILIACIGNIFLGDDAFGVEVAQRLAKRPLPPGVRLVDFGIRGLDLAYALIDTCDIAILVDAAPRGQAPGTLYVIEPDPIDPNDNVQTPADLMMQTHGMDPMKVLRLVSVMGTQAKRILLVGCEPGRVDLDEMEMGLSPPVQAAVEEAVTLIESLLPKVQLEYETLMEESLCQH